MKKAKSIPEAQLLRVLILEDNPADAELMIRELRRSGIAFAHRLVEGKREFSKALAAFQPQVILSDFKLPKFDGLAALELTRQAAPNVPFIFVSGLIGEEKAIETLAQGASDYIFKDNLARLGPAVRRAVEDSRMRAENRRAEEALRRHAEETQVLAAAADRFVHLNDLEHLYGYLAATILDVSGASQVMLSLYDNMAQALRPMRVPGGEALREAVRRHAGAELEDLAFQLKDMQPDDFRDLVSRRLLPARRGLFGLFCGQVARPACRAAEKSLEAASMYAMGFSWENQLFGRLTVLFRKGEELRNAGIIEALANLAAVAIKRLRAEESLRASEEKFRTLVTQSPDGIFIISLDGKFLSVNQALCDGLKYSQEEILSLRIQDIVPEAYMDLHRQRLAEIMKGRALNEAAEYQVRGKDGKEHIVAILSAPFFQDRQLVGFQGIARDITEKKKMELRLRESEEFHRTLVETSPEAIVTVDGGGRITFASQRALELFAVPGQAGILGTSMLDFVESAEIPRVQARMVEILSGRSRPEVREYRLRLHDGTPFWSEVSSAPLRDSKGRPIGLMLVCRDVSERRRIEDALRESEAKYRLIADNTAETIFVLDMDLRFTYVSPSIFKLRGYTVAESLPMTLQQMLTPDSLARIQQTFKEEIALEASGITDPKRSRSLELEEYRKDGSIVWVENSLSFLRDPQGKPIGILAVSRDISERKQAEELIRTSLKEKEVLLQEIHHRVKNNLQIVSGLLTMQADQVGGRTLDEIFRTSQDRIRSIALVHEKLYRSHNLAEIAFDDYLRVLVDNLVTSHFAAAGRVAVQYDMERILLTIETAIPLGLIVNEVVTNALKYAFPGERRGVIRIGFHGREKDRFVGVKTESGTLYRVPTCELAVADDGIGLPAGCVPGQQKTLGLQLVFLLAKQLQAEVKFSAGPGAEFQIVFPGSPHKGNPAAAN